MRIADDTEAIGRRYRELFQPSSEQPSPPKPEPETKSAAERMCACGRPVSDCFFCVGKIPLPQWRAARLQSIFGGSGVEREPGWRQQD